MAQVDELRELIYCADVPATVGTRARIVLWFGENRPKKEIAAMAGVSRPTVNLWLSRYEAEGVAGLPADRPEAERELVLACGLELTGHAGSLIRPRTGLIKSCRPKVSTHRGRND